MYTLGVRSRVDKLELLSGLCIDIDFQRLNVVLSDARMTIFEVMFRVPDFDPLRLGSALAPATKTLKELALDCNLHIKKYLDPTLDIVSLAAA